MLFKIDYFFIIIKKKNLVSLYSMILPVNQLHFSIIYNKILLLFYYFLALLQFPHSILEHSPYRNSSYIILISVWVIEPRFTSHPVDNISTLFSSCTRQFRLYVYTTCSNKVLKVSDCVKLCDSLRNFTIHLKLKLWHTWAQLRLSSWAV